MKCEMCQNHAEVTVTWQVTAGQQQQHNVCEPCGHSIWEKISRDFSGTEAYASFTIDNIEG